MTKMSDAEYFAAAGVSQSTLKLFRKSPAHARYVMLNRREPSASMKIGSAVHSILLEGFECHAVLPESMKGQSKAAIMAREEFQANNLNKIILTQAEANQVQCMVDSVKTHEGAKKLLAITEQAEVSLFWKEECGTACRGKLDGIMPIGVLDLKSTQGASIDEFAKSIYNFGYHIQAAHYLAGAAANNLPCENFYIIAVENTPPYCTAVFVLEHESIEAGEKERKKLLQIYNDCVKNDNWPGYSDKIQAIGLPQWALRKINEENENYDY